MKNLFPLFFLMVFSFGCNKSLVQTKQYVGSSKDTLMSHFGDPRLMIPNGEKGEILVYLLSEGGEIMKFGGETVFYGNVTNRGGILDEDKRTWNYVVFLVDLDDRVYHTSKKFYLATPYNLEYLVLEQYGDS